MRNKHLLFVLLLLMIPSICSAEGQRGIGEVFLGLVFLFSIVVALIIGYIIKGIISFTKYKPSNMLVFGLSYLAVFIFIIIALNILFSS
jgi:hypothetical protein